jgi:hypothetical protein
MKRAYGYQIVSRADLRFWHLSEVPAGFAL